MLIKSNEYLESIYKGNLDWLTHSTIFLTKYGSQAYGLNTPESDLDLRGIAIPPKSYFLGYVNQFEQAEMQGEIDFVIYDIRKFFKLAADGNPSIIEQLFVNEEDHVFRTYSMDRILLNRNLFLSQKIKHTFCGYSHSQLHRIKAHRRWLLNEHDMHKPARAEFGLPEQSVLSAEIRGAIDKLEGTGAEIKFSDEVMHLLHKEREYASACTEWRNYQTWLAQRNPKRAAIERKIGFDGKHCSQLMRLLMMCEEILETGQVIVKRPVEHRDFLLSIKQGTTDWRYEKMMEWVDAKNARIEELVLTTKLPHKPNHNKLNKLLIDIVDDFNRD